MGNCFQCLAAHLQEEGNTFCNAGKNKAAQISLPPHPQMMIFIIQMFQLSGCLIQSLEGDISGVLLALLLILCSNHCGVAFTKGFS